MTFDNQIDLFVQQNHKSQHASGWGHSLKVMTIQLTLDNVSNVMRSL